ncbi:hypothetical protein [Ferruginibacter sp. SUN106]|uniref:hypothetical protein n=1 Tax=Ferruginibacter sp. SUN106 TaxID=2978348 RepID=UPI003D366056
MREALKHVFSQQITLEDNSQFYYTVKPYELTNALGNVIAVLQEYTFTKKEEHDPLTCRLYKTKEGNWYDIEEAKILAEKSVLRMLKSAIDMKEGNVIENR